MYRIIIIQDGFNNYFKYLLKLYVSLVKIYNTSGNELNFKITRK